MAPPTPDPITDKANTADSGSGNASGAHPLPGGVYWLPGLLPAADCLAWTTLADTLLAEARQNLSVGKAMTGFQPHSSSLQLAEVAPAALDQLLDSLRAGPLATVCQAMLGPQAWLKPDACWLRRQYPPDQAPPDHHPHQWHQDGALQLQFPNDPQQPPPAEALLQMCTCWIALGPCGRNAPGLEWRAAHALGPPSGRHSHPTLLALDQLQGAGLQQQLAALPGHTPPLATGDALCFDGALLHRTQQQPGQTQVRTSLELRFFGPCVALERLGGQALRCWP